MPTPSGKRASLATGCSQMESMSVRLSHNLQRYKMSEHHAASEEKKSIAIAHDNSEIAGPARNAECALRGAPAESDSRLSAPGSRQAPLTATIAELLL